ncbi:DUF1566 domain-containing protein [Pendulispora brunnea]|uniref:DUF1566 domain-containing protein n=1 Tax=Pendulispora brunnea TaxID=2905690 RepID=A0ABZ2K421_9BACT
MEIVLASIGIVASTVDCRAILGIEDDAPLLPPNFDGGVHPVGEQRFDDGGRSDEADGGADGGTGSSSSENVDRTEPQWPLPVLSPPPANYEVTDDTVLDKTTGLMWQRKIGNQPTKNWPEPPRVCAALQLAGYDDWRLPTRIEFVSIMDYGGNSDAINRDRFPLEPNVSNYSAYWTISAYVAKRRTGARWEMDPVSGTAWLYDENVGPKHFRCVRGGRVSSTQPRFTVEGTLVRDTRTGLVWEKSAGPAQDITSARHRCEDLKPAGYRLPSLREIQTLIDERQTEVPIWYDVFDPPPSGTSPVLWTSAYDSRSEKYAFIDFSSGGVSMSQSDTLASARCVR